MLESGTCFLSKAPLHDNCIRVYRINEDNSVEQLSVSDSSVQITTLPHFDLTPFFQNIISNDCYREIKALLIDLFSTYQRLEDKASSVSYIQDQKSECYFHKQGFFRNIGVRNGVSRPVLLGIHLNEKCNLHRSIELVSQEDLLNEELYRRVDPCYYDSLDSLIQSINDSTKKILSKQK